MSVFAPTLANSFAGLAVGGLVVAVIDGATEVALVFVVVARRRAFVARTQIGRRGEG